jgi:hypothetical protein
MGAVVSRGCIVVKSTTEMGSVGEGVSAYTPAGYSWARSLCPSDDIYHKVCWVKR